VVLCGTTLLSAAQEQPIWAQLIAIFILLLAQLMEMHVGVDDAVRGFPSLLREAAEYTVRVTRPGGSLIKPSSELRSGEEVIVGQDETVPVDGVIASGEALIIPWHGVEQTESVASGRRIVAGAHVVSGELVIVATKTGAQRAFHAPDAFVRQHGPLKWAGWVSWVWGPSLGLLSSLLLRLQEQAWLSCIAAGISVAATFALPGALRHAQHLLRRSWVEAAKRGIAYCDAQVFERAGQVNSAVFCARGSVLSGEPDVAEVHVWRDATEETVLAIAAGAESAVHHPIASATIRAAHHRGVSIDACRGHHVSAGLGVTCSSSEGRAVVVGSRELLLRERISVAIAEETLRMLETRGNSTLLVAVDGRLIGVLGLQDTLRTGARAAFQLLLDHKLEPILLSGDARATTEAVARSLSCEHVRPEVPALARSREVRSLIDSGLVVAVVGNSPRDDVALGAASVPIILEGAAMVRSDSPHGHERGIGLAGDRVIDATIALLIAKQGRHNLQMFLACWLLLGALGSALVTSQLAPLFMAPILGFAGVKVGGYLARNSAILRP
jgi:cation transport ATPase